MEENVIQKDYLTILAEAKLEIIKALGRMGMNDGNDLNGNWAKWKELKEQSANLDKLIEKGQTIL